MSNDDFFILLMTFYMSDASNYTEDTGGKKSLDHLFVFEHQKSELLFATNVWKKVQKL